MSASISVPKRLYLVRFIAVQPHDYTSGSLGLTTHAFHHVSEINASNIEYTTTRSMIQILTFPGVHFQAFSSLLAYNLYMSGRQSFRGEPYFALPQEVSKCLLGHEADFRKPEEVIKKLFPMFLEVSHVLMVGSEALCRVLAQELCKLLDLDDKNSPSFKDVQRDWSTIDVFPDTGAVTFTPYNHPL